MMAQREVPRGGKWFYPLLLLVETTGALLLAWQIFRGPSTAIIDMPQFLVLGGASRSTNLKLLLNPFFRSLPVGHEVYPHPGIGTGFDETLQL